MARSGTTQDDGQEVGLLLLFSTCNKQGTIAPAIAVEALPRRPTNGIFADRANRASPAHRPLLRMLAIEEVWLVLNYAGPSPGCATSAPAAKIAAAPKSLLLNHGSEQICATYGVYKLSADAICRESALWPVIEQQALRRRHFVNGLIGAPE